MDMLFAVGSFGHKYPEYVKRNDLLMVRVQLHSSAKPIVNWLKSLGLPIMRQKFCTDLKRSVMEIYARVITSISWCM